MNSTTFYIYLFNDNKNKYLFCSNEVLNDFNINNYLMKASIEYDSKKHEYRLVEIFSCQYEIEVLIHMDKYLHKYKMVPNSYNESYYFVNIPFDMTNLSQLQNKIFINVQKNKFKKLFNDKTKYNNILAYIYDISIEGKKYLGWSPGVRTLSHNIEYIYALFNFDAIEYRKLLQILKNTKYENIKVTILYAQLKKSKIEKKISVLLEEEINKLNTIKDGLNVEPIIKKYKVQRYNGL
jgi:hypothetical protein